MSRAIFLAALVTLAVACSTHESKAPRDERGLFLARRVPREAGTVTGVMAEQQPADEVSVKPDPFDRVTPGTALSAMIIRTGQVSVEVDSLASAIARVRALAERVGGYIANTEIQTGQERFHSATIEIKVPSDRFDDALQG